LSGIFHRLGVITTFPILTAVVVVGLKCFLFLSKYFGRGEGGWWGSLECNLFLGMPH
jgi:hypothetical protein